jgi:hypothetical protein
LVYGFARAEVDGWTGPTPLVLITAGVLLLGVFILLERRVAHPLLPMRILADRARGGALVSLALSNIGIFAVFLFLTFVLQENLDLSPLATGVAFLPIVAGITFASTAVAPQLLTRRGPRRPIAIGALLGAVALGWLSTQVWAQTMPGCRPLRGLRVPARRPTRFRGDRKCTSAAARR